MAQTATRANPNFSNLLDLPPSEDDRPKAMPVGSYLCRVVGLPRFDKSPKKQTDFVEFTLSITQAGADVDAEALEEVGGIEGKTIKATYYLTDNAIFMLNDFLEHCGIEAGRPRKQMIDDTPNCEVVAYIRHEARQDGQGVQARLGKTAPADSFNAGDK